MGKLLITTQTDFNYSKQLKLISFLGKKTQNWFQLRIFLLSFRTAFRKASHGTIEKLQVVKEKVQGGCKEWRAKIPQVKEIF